MASFYWLRIIIIFCEFLSIIHITLLNTLPSKVKVSLIVAFAPKMPPKDHKKCFWTGSALSIEYPRCALAFCNFHKTNDYYVMKIDVWIMLYLWSNVGCGISIWPFNKYSNQTTRMFDPFSMAHFVIVRLWPPPPCHTRKRDKSLSWKWVEICYEL